MDEETIKSEHERLKGELYKVRAMASMLLVPGSPAYMGFIEDELIALRKFEEENKLEYTRI